MIYESELGFSISSGGAWLPGLYDTRATARYAFQFPGEVLQALSDRICRIGGENRLITKADLKAARVPGKLVRGVGP